MNSYCEKNLTGKVELRLQRIFIALLNIELNIDPTDKASLFANNHCSAHFSRFVHVLTSKLALRRPTCFEKISFTYDSVQDCLIEQME